MSVSMKVRIEGAGRLQMKLRRMPQKVRGRLLVEAANAWGRVIRDSARDHAPRRPGGDSGKLARNIVNVITKKADTSVTAGVSWKTGKASRTPGFYGLFVHEGTRERTRKSGGPTGAVTKPHRFLVMAQDEKGDAADRAMAAVLRRGVEVAARG